MENFPGAFPPWHITSTVQTGLRWDTAPSILTFKEAAFMLRWTEERLSARMEDALSNELNQIPYIANEDVTTFPANKLREWADREADL